MSDYPNSGILFRNNRKRDGSRDPDHTGNCEIAGVQYDIAAWVKDGKKGKFFSLSFKPKPDYSADEARKRAAAGDVDDDGGSPF